MLILRFKIFSTSINKGLIGNGIPIQLVAQSMGNSIKVCEEYYSGYVLTDIGLNMIKNLLVK
jgi:hypothetical protein